MAMSPTPQPDRPGLLDGLNKFIATLAAVATLASVVMGVATAYTSNKLNELKEKVDRLQNERTYASQIYNKFDTIVTSDDDEQMRIDRLSGLLALTELVDQEHEALRKRLALMIQDQTGRYAETLEKQATANPKQDAQANAQLAQLRQLGRQAAAVSEQTRWSNYDFDVFWCASGPKAEASRKLASQIVALRSVDPTARGAWRSRSLGDAGARNLKASGYSIRYDYDDELPFANALLYAMRANGLSGSATPFKIDQARTKASRWYLSVFVCPT